MVDNGFTLTELKQLKELFGIQEQQLETKFIAQQKWLDLRFEQERMYFTQLIHQEIKRLEDKIDLLQATESEDVVAVSDDVIQLKNRVKVLERTVKELQAV